MVADGVNRIAERYLTMVETDTPNPGERHQRARRRREINHQGDGPVNWRREFETLQVRMTRDEEEVLEHALDEMIRWTTRARYLAIRGKNTKIQHYM